MNANEAVYTTTTGDAPVMELEDHYYEWCFVCSRPTDHRAEHDDLVEVGRARYDEHNGVVHYISEGVYS